MLDFKIVKHNNKKYIETSLDGKVLMGIPQLNKGTAFSEEERHQFGLKGKLPIQVESLQQQVARAYIQYQSYTDKLQQNIFLKNLHNKNQVLFYKLVETYLKEMLPIVYTPVVGTAVKKFSNEFRQPHGLYIPYAEQECIDEILDNRTNPEIDLLVVTDGEGVLGIGDQGIGGMDIPVAKLMVYTLFGGINPLRTLPILLDVGTNNKTLLDDPMYLGWRHERISGAEYNTFVDKFVAAVKRKFPKAFLHWEDFGRINAYRNLSTYQEQICSFNDDIQGTGVVTVTALLSAINANKAKLEDQQIVVYGAGSAGVGIAEQICAGMVRAGLTLAEARKHFYLLDRNGLISEYSPNLSAEQRRYVRTAQELETWDVTNAQRIPLLEVIKNVKPTVLIGSSGSAGAFTQEVVETMAANTKRPIIFPLSNPTENSEAQPADLLKWTDGNVLIATGSPFEDVEFKGKKLHIAQCNNALAFPGIGLAMVATKATHLSDDMLWEACCAMTDAAPIYKDPTAPLLPKIEEATGLAKKIALAVAKQAEKEGKTQLEPGISIEKAIEEAIWENNYLPYKKK